VPHPRRFALILVALLLSACSSPPRAMREAPIPTVAPPMARPQLAPQPDQPKPAVHEVDLDGDSIPEVVTWSDTVVTVTTQTGRLLLEHDLGNLGASAQTGAKVIRVPGEPALLILSAAVRCVPATASAHFLFQFDGATLQPAEQQFPTCSMWRELGGGQIQVDSYEGAVVKRQTFQWLNATLTLQDGPVYSIMAPRIEPDTLEYALQIIMAHGAAVEGGEALFETINLYERFLAKVGDGATWEVGEWSVGSCPADQPIRVPLLRDGQPGGALLVRPPCDTPVRFRVTAIED